MSEVQRFWSHDASNIRCVREADFERVTAERDALQELLNQRDEANHDLEQRRHAEQQACQAAERRVEELDRLLAEFSKRYRSGIGGYLDLVERIDAALNPTAEAASHEE